MAPVGVAGLATARYALGVEPGRNLVHRVAGRAACKHLTHDGRFALVDDPRCAQKLAVVGKLAPQVVTVRWGRNHVAALELPDHPAVSTFAQLDALLTGHETLQAETELPFRALCVQIVDGGDEAQAPVLAQLVEQPTDFFRVAAQPGQLIGEQDLELARHPVLEHLAVPFPVGIALGGARHGRVAVDASLVWIEAVPGRQLTAAPGLVFERGLALLVAREACVDGKRHGW